MNKSNNLIKLVLSALFAALCCVATMVIQIPTPTGGFLNLGDAVVILSAFSLGPVYGTLAAGIGSCLADILAGYAQYAPATLIIKSLVALSVCATVKLLQESARKAPVFLTLSVALGGVFGELIMVAGYFIFECFILNYGAGAAVSVVPNLIQGAVGVIAGTILSSLITRTKIKDKISL